MVSTTKNPKEIRKKKKKSLMFTTLFLFYVWCVQIYFTSVGFLEVWLLDHSHSSGYFQVDKVSLKNHISSNNTLINNHIMLFSFYNIQVQCTFCQELTK